MTRKLIRWTEQETTVVLDLYFRFKETEGGLPINEEHPYISETGRRLRKLPLHPERDKPVDFRNPHAVWLKMKEFEALDPACCIRAPFPATEVDEVVWNRYEGNREGLKQDAERIISGG